VQDQDGLSEAGEQHEVGFPMAGLAAIESFVGTLIDGQAQLDCQGGAAAAGGPASSTPAFGPGQVVAPAAVVAALELSIDEAIDRFAADYRVASLERQAAANRGGGPTILQVVEHGVAQRRVTVQAGT